jgi:hypothetical protein
MSDNLLVRYVGFQAKERVREYIFRVQHADDEPREFVLSINNEAFGAGRVRYQDAPDLCSLKLRRELAASAADQLLKTHFDISDAELDDYRTAHTHQIRRAFRPPRPDQHHGH